MTTFIRDELEHAARLVHRHVPPTPQYAWPTLAARTGCTVWVKHENHTPTGAFKARGAVTFIDWLRRTHPEVTGVVSATRGNHGQGLARAATAAGLSTRVVVPHGNSSERNAAMRAFGATLPPASNAGREVAVILCGGNVDTATFAEVLAGGTPTP